MVCGLRTRGHVALPATLCSKPAPYRRRDPTRTPLYQLVTSRLEPFLASREDTCDPKRGYLPPEVRNTYERFLQCGVYGFGAARFSCNACGRDKAVALSCRKRGICARCTAKTLAIWIDQIDTDVLPQVNYRQWVLALPKRIRHYFRFDPSLRKRLAQLVFRVITEFVRTLTGRFDLTALMISCDQSFGTLLAYTPHLHNLVADGGFTPDGAFVPIGRIRDKDRKRLEQLLRRRILAWLVRDQKLPAAMAKSMRTWRHSGFSLHIDTCVDRSDRAGLLRMCEYMRRHPFVSTGIRYNADTDKVIYRAKRVHGGDNRNFAVFSADEFLAALADHIPHRRTHTVRYYGAAHPAVRKRLFGSTTVGVMVPASAKPTYAETKGRRSWARQIWRIFQTDPLRCDCGGEFRLISILFDWRQLDRFLGHLGLDSTRPTTAPARAPPQPTSAAMRPEVTQTADTPCNPFSASNPADPPMPWDNDAYLMDPP